MFSRLFLTSDDEAFHWISQWLEIRYTDSFNRIRARGDVRVHQNNYRWSFALADRIIEFDLLSPELIQRLFDRILPDSGLLFSGKVKPKSAAEVQGICMTHLEDPQRALELLSN